MMSWCTGFRSLLFKGREFADALRNVTHLGVFCCFVFPKENSYLGMRVSLVDMVLIPPREKLKITETVPKNSLT